MKERGILVAWRKLTKDQKTDFGHCVNSRYLNNTQHENVKRLYNNLKEYSPEFNITPKDAKDLSKKLFSNYREPAVYFNHVMSYLLEVMEKFLMMEMLKKNKGWQSLFLMKAWREKNLKKLFRKAEANLSDKLKSSEESSFEKLWLPLMASEISLQAFQSPQNRIPGTDIKCSMALLDEVYATQKLRYTCEILNRGKILNDKTDMTKVETFISILLSSHQIQSTSGKIYALIFDLLKRKEPEKVALKIVSLTKKSDPSVSDTTKRDALLYVINYYLTELNSGENKFLAPLLCIYEEMERKNIILENGKIDPGLFKNAMIAWLKAGKIDRAIRFVSNFYSSIEPPGLREPLKHYVDSLILLEMGDIEGSYSAITDGIFLYTKDVFFNIALRVQELKVLFMLGNKKEELVNKANSLIQFVKLEKKVNADKKAFSINFGRYIKRLTANKNMVILRLRKEIELESKVLERTWLLSRLEKMPAGNTGRQGLKKRQDG